MPSSLRLVHAGLAPQFDVVDDDPAPGDGELLLRLLAAEVVPLDVQIARGFFPGAAPPPLQPGLSAVAEVLAGGEAGALVCVQGGGLGLGVTRPGTFAERFVAPAECVVPLPDGLDPVAAAVNVGSALTAVLVLDRLAQLQSGETVLVLGASGGIGRACAQLAAARGARVLAGVRRPGTAPDGALEVPLAGLAESVAGATDGAGADVLVDCVGGEHVDDAVRSGALHARHVLIGYAAGLTATVTLPLLLLREHRLLGFNQFLVRGEDLRSATREALVEVAAGVVDLPVGERHPLREAAAAYGAVGGHRVLLEGR